MMSIEPGQCFALVMSEINGSAGAVKSMDLEELWLLEAMILIVFFS